MKPKTHSCRHLGLIVVSLAVAGFASQSAMADNTWTGGGTSTNWSDSGNWTSGAVSGSYFGTLTFTTGGTQGTTSIDDVAGANGNMLLWTGSSAWILNGSNNIALYDNGGTQARIENQSSGLVTINAPVTFAATSGAAWGEINAVNGDLTFGGGTLEVSGSAVAGIKMFGAGRTTTFNNTVSASGKWFATTGATASTVAVGGAFTSGDIYLMNGSTLKLNSGGSITTSGLRLGGDFGTTLTQNLTLGATFQLTSLTGGQTFSSSINSVSGNTSNALLIDSQNASGTNTLGGSIFLDSALKIQQAAGGTLSLTGGSIDLKAQTLTIQGFGSTNIGDVISNSTGSGTLSKAGAGTLTLSGANTYSGPTLLTAGTLVLANPQALQNTSTLTISTGTVLDINTDGSDTAFATNFGTGTITTLLSNVKTGGVGINHTLGAASYGGGTVNIAKGSNVTSGTASITIGSVALTSGTAGAVTVFNPTTATASLGNVTITTNNSAKTLGLDGTSSGNAVTGTISNGLNVVSVSKTNTSTWTLSGANNYTGTTTVSAGTLNLTGSLSGSSGLSIGAGTLNYNPTVANSTQAVASTGLTAGGSTLSVATGSTFNLGTTTRSAGAVLVVDKSTNTGTVSTSLANTNGIAGSWAVVKGSGAAANNSAGGYTYGTISGGSLGSLSSGVTAITNLGGAGAGGTTATTVNYDDTGSTASAIGSSRGANTIRYIGSGVTESAANANTLFINGIMNAGTGAFVLPSLLSLEIGSAKELTLVAATNAITVNGVIKNTTVNNGGVAVASALTIAGSGSNVITLSGTNTYTGGTYITSGTVSTAADLNLGAAASAVSLNGGTWRTTNTALVDNTHVVTVGAGGGAISMNGTATSGQGSRTRFNVTNTLLGSGALLVTGNGTLGGAGSTGTTNGGAGALVLNKANTYSGTVTLQNGGLIEFAVANAMASTATVVLGNEGELTVVNGVTSANSIIVNGGTNSVLSFSNGAATSSGAITLNANLTVGLRNWYNYAGVISGTISGALTGTGGLLVVPGTGTGGTLTLSNANSTFSGGTTLSGGSTLAAAAGSTSTNGVVTSGPLGTGSLTLTNGILTNSGTRVLANPVAVTTGTITAATGTNFTVNGNITGSGSSTLGLSGILTGSGLYLGGNNSGFSGTATVTGANTRLTATSASSAAAKWVVNGNLQLEVTGNNTFNFGELSSTVGTGGISGHATNAVSATSTLSVGALNTNSTFSGAIADMPANNAASGNLDSAANTVLALTKVGTGALTLSGTNTYTGATVINAGTLAVSGSLASGSAVSVNAGGSLAGTSVSNGSSTVAGSITVAGGTSAATQGAINLANGSIETLNIGSLTVGGSSGNYSQLNFNANGSTNTSDLILFGSGIFTVNAGGARITINSVGGVLTSGQTLNLLSFASGAGSFATGSGVSVGALTLTNPSLSFGVTGSLNVTSTSVQLVTSGSAAAATAYWLGDQGTTWASNDGTNGNFSTDKAGTTHVGAYPAASTDLIFAATGAANLTNTLGLDFSIKSLTFDATTAAADITGSNALTVGVGGIIVENGNGGATLGMTSLALGAAQTWANASSNDLAVSASITGAIGNALTINNTSTGKIVLSGANSYSGPTTINGGVLKAGSTGALSANSAYSLANAAGVLLDITGFHNSVGSLAGGGTAGGNVTLGAATLTAGADNTSTTYAGAINGTGGLTKSGSGTMVLTGANGYTGATTVNAGTLTASGGSAIADTSAVTLANFAGAAFSLSSSETIGSLAGGGAAGGNVALGANTLTTGGNNAATTYSGVISGTGDLTKEGTNTFALAGINTFSGNVVVNNGTLGSGTGLGSTPTTSNLGDLTATRSVTVNNGGTLLFTSGNVLGTGGSTNTLSGLTLVVNQGGVFQSGLNGSGAGWWNKIGAVNLNGGTINIGSGANITNFQGLALIGTVTVGGSSVSTIGTLSLSNNTSNGIHLGQNAATGQMITFDVADATGNSASDLNVSARLLNTSASSIASGLIKTGAGTMTLSGYSSYSGDTTINGGTLVANLVNNVNNAVTSALGNPQAVRNIAVNDGGTLNFAQGDTLGGATSTVVSTLAINAGGVVTNTAGNFTTLGPVVLNGGTLTTAGGAVAGYQSYSLSGGVTVGVASSLASTISVTSGGNAFNGVHLGANTTFNVADATGDGSSDLNVSAPLIDRNLSLGGAGGLTKTGAGTMTLSAANTYTGNTLVSAGTLALSGSGAIANSPVVTVSSGTTLDVSGVTAGVWDLGATQVLAGSGSVTGATNIQGTQRPGTAGTVGAQSFSSTLNYDTGSIFEWDLAAASTSDPGIVADAATGTYDQVVSAGAITGGAAIFKVVLGGNTFADAFWDTDKSWTNIFSGAGTPAALSSIFSGFSATGGLNSAGVVVGEGQFTFNGSTSTLNWSAVPEPTSALAGVLLAAGLLRRRRSA